MNHALRSLIARAGIPIRKLAWEAERMRWRLFHPVTMGARVILLREREVLLIRHTYRPGWYFPGGGVDKGETLEAAAIREAREECQAHVASVELLGVYTNLGEGKSDHIAVFIARQFDIGDFAPNNEIAERRWFPLETLPEDLSPATRRRLEELALGGPIRANEW